jgi:hypothetical protein
MKFRGLRSVVVERDAKSRATRRETIVETVFARGMATDARPLWCLMAHAFTGEPQVSPRTSARSAAQAALAESAN